eukprot:112031-Pleurochrysis_carterae.AAC.1
MQKRQSEEEGCDSACDGRSGSQSMHARDASRPTRGGGLGRVSVRGIRRDCVGCRFATARCDEQASDENMRLHCHRRTHAQPQTCACTAAN